MLPDPFAFGMRLRENVPFPLADEQARLRDTGNAANVVEMEV